MKTQKIINHGFTLLVVIVCIFAYGCTAPAEEKQETESAKVEEPAKTEKVTEPTCEVEKKGQQVQNKLLVAAENMNSTMSKLHEVIEEHDHKDITEHAEEVEKYTLDMMKQSVFLPVDKFAAVREKSRAVLELSTQYSWENRYFGFPENSITFKSIEEVIDELKGYVKGMRGIPDKICETEKRIAKNEIAVYMDIMDVYIEQVDRSADRNCLDCVVTYCEKMEGFVKTFRETITNIDTKDFTTLNRTLADIEHTVHEMKEKAEASEKEELHHAHENILRHMTRLDEEVDEIG